MDVCGCERFGEDELDAVPVGEGAGVFVGALGVLGKFEAAVGDGVGDGSFDVGL